MGCDGYIIDPTKPVLIEANCYVCGKIIDLNDAGDVARHEICGRGYWSDRGIPIRIEIDNYNCR